jgi:NAD-dependent deacetylase
MSCDVFIAIGTSLTVFPVAYLPQIAASRGARLAILNAEATPYDDLATWVIRDPLSESVPGLAAAV